VNAAKLPTVVLGVRIAVNYWGETVRPRMAGSPPWIRTQVHSLRAWGKALKRQQTVESGGAFALEELFGTRRWVRSCWTSPFLRKYLRKNPLSTCLSAGSEPMNVVPRRHHDELFVYPF
jgi:hypothetical protein